MILMCVLSVIEFLLIIFAFGLMAFKLLNPAQLKRLQQPVVLPLSPTNSLRLWAKIFVFLLIASLPLLGVLVMVMVLQNSALLETAWLIRISDMMLFGAMLVFAIPTFLLLVAPIVMALLLLLQPWVSKLAEPGMSGERRRNKTFRVGMVVFALALLLHVVGIMNNPF